MVAGGVMHVDFPVIDMARLQQEVISHGPAAALPSNLSDQWLQHISYSLDQVLNGKDELLEYFSAPMVLVLNLMLKKFETKQVEIEYKEMIEYFRQYRLELALEEVSRISDIKVDSATLKTIFTDRRVEFTRKI